MQTRARLGCFCVLRLSEQLKNPMKLGQKSVKNLVGFWGDLKTPKFHSEIKWPLELVFQWLYQIKDSKPIQSIWKKDVCWHSLGNPKTVLQFVCFQNEILWSKHLTEYCIDNSPRFWVQFPGAPKSSLQSITTSILQLFAPQTFFCSTVV